MVTGRPNHCYQTLHRKVGGGGGGGGAGGRERERGRKVERKEEEKRKEETSEKTVENLTCYDYCDTQDERQVLSGGKTLLPSNRWTDQVAVP